MYHSSPLLFSFICVLFGATNTLFGMNKSQELSLFYAKINDQYVQLDQRGHYILSKNNTFPLSCQLPEARLLYDNDTHKYHIKNTSMTIGAININDKLVTKLTDTIAHQHPVYAKLNDNYYTRITSITSPNTSDSKSFEFYIEKYKREGILTIIDDDDMEELNNKKFSLFPSYTTIAKSLATLALIYIIIKYIHRLPQLFNKILRMQDSELQPKQIAV